jgi:hypothetical protein
MCAPSLLFGVVVAALGLVSMPAFAGPHVPFSVSGTITMIDIGDVKPAGQSGRFILRDRHITGTFTGSISGPFVHQRADRYPVRPHLWPSDCRCV